MKSAGFTILELLVVITLIALMSGVAVISIPNLRVNTELSAAVENILRASQDARRFSASGRQLAGALFPSYGISFRMATPQDIVLYADCNLDDDGSGMLDTGDNFVFNVSGTQCNGGNGLIERVRISKDSQIQIREIRTVITSAVSGPSAHVLYMRPDPSTWITGVSGTLLTHGRVEVVVGTADGTRKKVIQFWTSGHIDVK